MHRATRWLRQGAAFARAAAARAAAPKQGRRALAAAVAVATVGTAIVYQSSLSNAMCDPARNTKHTCCAASGPRSTPPSTLTPLQQAQIELTALLGADRVSSEASELSTHTSDAYSYHKSVDEGLAEDSSTLRGLVVYPSSTLEVSRIVKICARLRVSMIPYGSGTSLEGHTSSPEGGVYIDLSTMQSIKALNVADMDCTVDPGLSWNNLNAALKEHGLFYPVDPGPGASLGGMVATNCSGTNAVRYGTMKHNVLNLTVVLPDGSIVHTGNRARKSSAGYDLTRLFIGSEGTLGIVTEVTLRLSTIPASQAVATCSFGSIGKASESVIEILQRGVRVGCVELLDDGCIEAVNRYAGLNYPPKPATLFFKFSGSAAGVKDDIEQVSEIVAKHGAGPFTFATAPEAREKIWEARKGALWGCIAYRPGCEAVSCPEATAILATPARDWATISIREVSHFVFLLCAVLVCTQWTTDVCVPISRLAECIEQTKADLVSMSGPFDEASSAAVVPASSSSSAAAAAAAGSAPARASFPSAVVGHVGDGNFHVIMMLDPSNPAELALAREVNERMVRRAIDMEGTCTGEHGVGVGKKKYLEDELGVEAIDLMRTVKAALDPHNLMNPGKVFDMKPTPWHCAGAARTGCHDKLAHRAKKHGGCCA